MEDQHKSAIITWKTNNVVLLGYLVFVRSFYVHWFTNNERRSKQSPLRTGSPYNEVNWSKKFLGPRRRNRSSFTVFSEGARICPSEVPAVKGKEVSDTCNRPRFVRGPLNSSYTPRSWCFRTPLATCPTGPARTPSKL